MLARDLLVTPGMRNLARTSILPSALLVVAFGCSESSSTGGVAGPSGATERPGAASPSAGSGAAGPSGPSFATGSTGVGAASTGTSPGVVIGAAGSSGAAGSGGVTTSTTPANQLGSLTAGTWDDNLNFDFYEKYLATMNAAQIAGLPLIERAGRLEITVADGAGAPIAGARVSVSDASGKLFEAPTRGDGKLFFFPGTVGAQTGETLTIAAAVGQASATASAHVGDAKVALAMASTTAAPVATLDLALVVDTTGSMGDELQYLKVEMSNIIARVAVDFPNVSQRWSAIFYRDTVDRDPTSEYVVRAFDFTTSVETLESEIAAQGASGGGDTPEAPEQALARLTKLSWRPDAVARMAFWVADAPHHASDAPVMVQDILAASGLGIRLYPIAASGTDDLLEYTMRTAAEVTGGRYLFLTNDSGIGGNHKEPTIPCYLVTTLNEAMRRMIDMELTGVDHQPAAADILRTSGDPKDGTCVLDGGQIVTVL
jgi:hypothetical protein